MILHIKSEHHLFSFIGNQDKNVKYPSSNLFLLLLSIIKSAAAPIISFQMATLTLSFFLLANSKFSGYRTSGFGIAFTAEELL